MTAATNEDGLDLILKGYYAPTDPVPADRQLHRGKPGGGV